MFINSILVIILIVSITALNECDKEFLSICNLCARSDSKIKPAVEKVY